LSTSRSFKKILDLPVRRNRTNPVSVFCTGKIQSGQDHVF
jgi:hypothetical protein